MNITKQLILTLTIALLALLLLGAGGAIQLQRAQERFDTVQNRIIPSIQGLNAAKGFLADSRLAGYRLSVFSNLADKTALDKAVADANTNFDKVIATYRAERLYDATDGKMLDADQAAMEAYRRALVPFFAAAYAGDMDGVRATLLAGTPLAITAAAAKKSMDDHIAYNNKLVDDVKAESLAAYDTAFNTMLAVLGVAVLLTGALAWHIYRTISGGLGNIEHTLERVSASLDLSAAMPVERMDEVGRTATAFNKFLERIVGVIATVRASADTVSVAAAQISAGNADLSVRTEQQASSLEETASSLEELTSAVRQNTDNARQANTLAVSASDVARKGGAVVAQVVGTMGSINESAKKIADIIGVIDGIAFQTNILALNAAVEAARAGEQGRGFAVVATEVRNLAQRSAAAAKEIKGLIEDSVDKVNTGSALVDQAGATMEEIVASIRRVTDIMGDIANASHEQSAGIEQVNQAISQMDQVTQQNAALVEEAAAAASSLQDRAVELVDVVAVFRLRGDAREKSLKVAGGLPAPAVAAASRRLALPGRSARA
ncbi:MCP four helix bundle domain-containing protein [Janthinobacterium sp. GW460P]|uniref:methyl-accepting chemotaxis protein n=1 Tax=unclassified Janthinobacterium TaxID=2610881 RepID=UPI000A322033|nr:MULTISPECIES: methyl-accepting chemotaxis protein [unclassified Janthinobacterium]MCC7703866.1 MCP four helix bundle domain-containing protein [Janthinobacterium sp. GW460P]MCC7709174.1 MCP four helix bundle domain-containing protein [Janthinobacterium sp. GW460W]